jgi:hypothetical protein
VSVTGDHRLVAREIASCDAGEGSRRGDILATINRNEASAFHVKPQRTRAHIVRIPRKHRA